MTEKANNLFIHGMLAEKAKLANILIAELLAEMPDDMLWRFQTNLQAGSNALQTLHNELRAMCRERGG